MQRSALEALDDSPAHVLARWKAAVEAKDLGALAALYHRDAQVLGFDMRLRGRDDIRDELSVPLRFLGQVRVLEGRRQAQAGDALQVELTIHSRLGRMRATHGFVVRNGLIEHHFIGTVHRDAGEHATA
jgi:hypothetical protein